MLLPLGYAGSYMRRNHAPNGCDHSLWGKWWEELTRDQAKIEVPSAKHRLLEWYRDLLAAVLYQ